MYNSFIMVYTITFNPSLDYDLTLEKDFNSNDINRMKTNDLFLGGKGVNSSLIFNKLNTRNEAIVFLDNEFGKIIKKKLIEEKVKFKKFSTDETTRINVKVNTDEHCFEINGPKITLNKNQQQKLIKYLQSNLKEGDILMIMGSLSRNKISFFAKFLKDAFDKKVNIVFDIDSKKLFNFLKYEPFLIKPNKSELESLFDIKIKNDEIFVYARKLQDLGARNILVSLGSQGMMFLSEEKKEYIIDPIKIKTINPVGAGDSTIAGFVSAYIQEKDYVKALKLAAACGTATTNNEWLASTKDIKKFNKEVKVREIEKKEKDVN